MQNFNAYDQEQFEQQFKATVTYKQLVDRFQNVYFDKFLETRWPPTPRQRLSQVWISAVPWYYLQYLDISKTVFDIGCGINFFKPYFPNLIGIGAEFNKNAFYGDVWDRVDDNFYLNHKNTYESVFSINALHFHPLQDLNSICNNFADMLKPGGRGFLAMNIKRMLEHSEQAQIAVPTDLDSYIREQFTGFPFGIKVFDLDLSVMDAWLDGNLRIVFEK